MILGATIVAPDAGNLISEITVAMKAGMGLGALAAVIHPYPTQVCTRLPEDIGGRESAACLECTRASELDICGG